MSHPDIQTGPVFWMNQARDGLLAPVLVARIADGGDLAKFCTRNWAVVMGMVELVMKEKQCGVMVRNVGESKNFSISDHD